jgi:hypothetical protein
MYFFEAGFGQLFTPRPSGPAKPAPKARSQPPPKEEVVRKDGHQRWCPAPTGRLVEGCDLNLRIRFRPSLDAFLREVENAFARWMARPTARRFVKKLQNKLKEWHGEMVFFKLSENDPITVVADLDYRRSNGTWLVHDIELRLWRIEPKK